MKWVSVVSIFVVSLHLATVKAQENPETPIFSTVQWSPSSGFSLIKGPLNKTSQTVAWGSFTNAINQTGWSFLEVETDPSYPDEIQAHAVGYLEGHLTSKLIYWHWINTVQSYCRGKEDLCQRIVKHIHDNTRWVKSMVEKKRNKRAYWHQVGLFYDQYNGLVAGYNDSTETNIIPHGDLFWLNLVGDLLDLEQVYAHKYNLTNPHQKGDGHCSVLIKVLPKNEDLLVAHDTWLNYSYMLRVLKKYSLRYKMRRKSGSKLIPGHSITFSSYPGLLFSGDDFFTVSSGLVVTETTNENFNPDLWQYVRPKGQIMNAVRVMVANRLAVNGKHWTKIYAKHNSGTYNNQWMVVDYKRFKPGRNLKSGLLWVLEQLPGHIHAEDMTNVLKNQSFWSSYNIPYFADVFNMSNFGEQVKNHGNFFSHDQTPRALIFKRDQPQVQDLKSAIKLMRSNNFEKDPLSICTQCNPQYNAEFAISARNDLNERNGTYPLSIFGESCAGGFDMKITNREMIEKLEFVAQSGPTFDNLPPFQWSKSDFDSQVSHVGQPDLWNFSPIHHVWKLPSLADLP